MNLTDITAYELIEKRPLADLNSEGLIFRHKKSGARVTVISNDDDNKVFYIGFRTPPADSTGVPHIIEHTVLCGSDKYPVKDPFVELVKGSLNTFLNAMTYPEKTIYPVASCNDRDFKNLMSVYMDAVLHPNIYKHEEIFKQEGWHYELESEEAPVTINGVVYNEMKGAFSSADDVLNRQILNSLFPDTCYANESGGDPLHIPELSYEEYLDFHRRYYHPCNSYIYLYGNMDVAERLCWMDREYLSHYEKIDLDSEIGIQESFSHTAEVWKKYPISSSESEENNTYLSYNKVVGSALDKELYKAFDVLDYALVSAPGAPLKQALIDAGIGSEITGGYDSGIKQPVFSVIAKNANSSDKERFLQIITETLEGLVKDGLNKKSLLAGINSAEFRFREADFGHYPKGLLYGLQCLDSWIYDDERPFLHLEAIETYRYLKEQVNTDYFERLIQTYLLDNPHASVVIVEPEKGLNARTEEELKKRLAAFKERLSEEEIRQLIADTAHLKAYQEEPSSKEDLEKIPMLTREDMKKEALPLSNEEQVFDGIKIIHHNYYSNGIAYLSLLFDIKDIAEADIPYLGILKSVLGYVDTETYSYADFANEVNIHTGGVGSGLGIYPGIRDAESLEARFVVRVKSLYDKIPQAVTLLEEMIFTSKLTDEKRLYEILAELKSRLQMSISEGGHLTAVTRAMSYFSKNAVYGDSIAFYQTVDDLESHFEERKEMLVQTLSRLIGQIFTTEKLMVGVTCDEEGYRRLLPELSGLKKKLSRGTSSGAAEFTLKKKNEGFMDASQVQYVARAGNFRAHGYDYHGALRILKVIMGYDYLWVNIRVKGGAYGCMNGYSRNGDTYFVSYRDPNLKKTNEVYDGIPDYLAGFTADEREMTKYIIGTIAGMDTPLNPYAKGERSMSAYLQKMTFQDIQKERDEVIGATQEDIRGLKDLVKAVLSDQNLCVIGNEETLKKEKELFLELKNIY